MSFKTQDLLLFILQLHLMPILDGQAILYSFESNPEVRIGVAFGSGGSQTLPATELPGVSSWLVYFSAMSYIFCVALSHVYTILHR